MNDAITVKDGLITGRLDSDAPVTPELLSAGPLAGHEIISVTEESQYEVGFLLAEYTPAGMLRPLLDRVLEGLRPVPDGMMLQDGQLIEEEVSPEDAPASLRVELEKARAALEASESSRKTQEAKINALIAENELHADLIQELALQAYQ